MKVVNFGRSKHKGYYEWRKYPAADRTGKNILRQSHYTQTVGKMSVYTLIMRKNYCMD